MLKAKRLRDPVRRPDNHLTRDYLKRLSSSRRKHIRRDLRNIPDRDLLRKHREDLLKYRGDLRKYRGDLRKRPDRDLLKYQGGLCKEVRKHLCKEVRKYLCNKRDHGEK